jgi:ribonuclease HII
MSLCGIDEAGRGCLAGPLAMAGVVLRAPIAGLNDSKKLSATRREKFYEAIVESSDYHIVLFEPATIDARGLSACLKEGLEAIRSAVRADRYLFDGHCTFGAVGFETLIKADAQVMEVAAASILAKVTKDRALIEAGRDYPEYGFEKHQGYGTKAHIEAIERYGFTPLHRKSFRPKGLGQRSLF